MDFSLLEPIFARSLVAEDCTGADRDWGYRCSAVETIPTRYGRAIEELIHRSSEPWTGAYLYQGMSDSMQQQAQAPAPPGAATARPTGARGSLLTAPATDIDG